jgi:hypothetical protein
VYDQDGNRYRYREHQMVVYGDEGESWPHEDIVVY